MVQPSNVAEGYIGKKASIPIKPNTTPPVIASKAESYCVSFAAAISSFFSFSSWTDIRKSCT